ncbi:hypothetical protein SAMD00019534_061470, partial [Acytostelium subglobosum LB1]|uniref:hypothetical protein n=1 Tax=Acytostelium subglobosum LB1 TaxID=1410327 RepID=UPI0006448A5C
RDDRGDGQQRNDKAVAVDVDGILCRALYEYSATNRSDQCAERPHHSQPATGHSRLAEVHEVWNDSRECTGSHTLSKVETNLHEYESRDCRIGVIVG